MKGQNDGVKNEIEIVEAYNNKVIERLTKVQKIFLQQLDSEVEDDTIVRAEKVGGQGLKPDVQIELNNKKWNVSVKKGKGNSVHQEKTDFFIYYCTKFLDMTEKEKNSLLKYLYGDGTIDGDSEVEDRLKEEELLETYGEEIKDVQKFLDRNKKDLIERFLIYGRLGKQKNISADYLYHGDAYEGVWCPLDDYSIEYIANMTAGDAQLSIGPLSLQVWNRNLLAQPNLEDRRHSIQVKWATCKTNIELINKEYLQAYNKLDKTQKRVMGDNRQGFNNQKKLVLLLDNQKVGKLESTLKEMIKDMFPKANNNDVVNCESIKDNDTKPRLCISIGEDKVFLSVFMGSGNSVHQENIKTFLPYCENILKMTNEEKIAFLQILYGDGTIDGNSGVDERLDDSQIKNIYKEQIRCAQKFLDRNKRDLVERFLVYGKSGMSKNIKSDYILYGTESTGRFVAYSDVVDYIVLQKNSANAILAIGNLTIQTWNRNLKKTDKYEKKRDSIQVKWGSMKTNLQDIRKSMDKNRKGTIDGDWEEYELVSKLNRNRNVESKIWKDIASELNLTDIKNIYAVKVCNTVYSSLAERNVLPKADVYLVKGNIDHSILIDNNYWLDEDFIDKLGVKFIDKSGISCKRPDSNSFTYAKLSMNSFVKLIKNRMLGAGIGLFVTENDIVHNENIVTDWGTNEEELIEYCKNALDKEEIKIDNRNLKNIVTCKTIKRECIAEFTKLIKEKKEISNTIFNGIGIFSEPYTATFTYINGEISTMSIPNFHVTTGSGRHKRRYTIVVKP